jgi:hypothetical protein
MITEETKDKVERQSKGRYTKENMEDADTRDMLMEEQ